MKTIVDPIAIEFCSAVLKVAQKLTPAELLYHARDKESLLDLLQKKDFEIMTSVKREQYQIPALRETTRGILWRKKLMRSVCADDFIESMSKKQPAVFSALVHSFNINTDLFRRELLDEIGDEETLTASAFSYSQIAWLASHHKRNHKKIPAVLSYEKPNYFPFITAGGKLIFASLHAKHVSFNKHQGWLAWFKPEKSEYFYKGILHLKEEILDSA